MWIVFLQFNGKNDVARLKQRGSVFKVTEDLTLVWLRSFRRSTTTIELWRSFIFSWLRRRTGFVLSSIVFRREIHWGCVCISIKDLYELLLWRPYRLKSLLLLRPCKYLTRLKRWNLLQRWLLLRRFLHLHYLMIVWFLKRGTLIRRAKRETSICRACIHAIPLCIATGGGLLLSFMFLNDISWQVAYQPLMIFLFFDLVLTSNIFFMSILRARRLFPTRVVIKVFVATKLIHAL